LKRIAGVIFLVILIASFAISCPSPAPPEVIKARFSGWAPPLHVAGQFETHFFEVLNEKVGDRLQVEVFQGNSLYNYQEVQIPLKTGAVEMIDMATGGLYAWVPEFEVTFLTGAWKVDTLLAYLNSPEFKPAWDKMLEVTNSIPICGVPSGGTWYLFSNRPINNTADFKGLRLISESSEPINLVTALGGSGGTVSITEKYSAFQQGRYDATIAAPGGTLGMGWGEFLKYVGTEAWSYNINFIFVNKDFWDSLPKDIQDAFNETAKETLEWSLATTPQAEAQQLAMLEEQWGMEYFSIEDWDKLVETARTQCWPEVESRVGKNFFDNAMKFAGLAD